MDPNLAKFAWSRVSRRPNLRGSQYAREFLIDEGFSPELRFGQIQDVRLATVAADLHTRKPFIYGLDPEQSILEGLMASHRHTALVCAHRERWPLPDRWRRTQQPADRTGSGIGSHRDHCPGNGAGCGPEGIGEIYKADPFAPCPNLGFQHASRFVQDRLRDHEKRNIKLAGKQTSSHGISTSLQYETACFEFGWNRMRETPEPERLPSSVSIIRRFSWAARICIYNTGRSPVRKSHAGNDRAGTAFQALA